MSEYSPYPLREDAAALGLSTTTLTARLGTVIAHHAPERSSTRATILLHGAAGSWTTWTALLAAARAAGRDIPDPVLLDLPGWGGATLASHSPTIADVADAVEDAARELGYTEWDLVGHSMGGFVALHLAATRAERVRSIVLVSGTTWSVVESVEHPVRRFGTLPGFTALWQVMRLLAALGPAGRALVRGLQSVRLLRLAVSPLFRHPLRIDGTVVAALARELRPRSFVIAAELTRGYDADATWAPIGCPVVALKGDRDVFVRDDDLQRLTRLLPQTRTVVVVDCGHFATAERPDVVLDALVTR